MVKLAAVMMLLWGISYARDASDIRRQLNSPIIVDNAWRFTAMSAHLIRIEYDVHQKFVDEPTNAFVRSKPLGTWIHAFLGGDEWSELETDGVILRYKRDLPPSNGTVMMISKINEKYTWTWGDDPEPGNLRGTARTLDSGAVTLDLNCHSNVSQTMPNSQMHCTWGLISRSGWAVVNETGMPIWAGGPVVGGSAGWYAPSRNSTDVSVFLHGLNFTGAMQDFYHAAGPPYVPPRWALGTIFTRWFDFDSDSVRSFVDEFQMHGMPLDAWIFDMNWHRFGPWGSFTWNHDSYPKLQEMLDWFQAKQLPVGANSHDHDGIKSYEQTFEEMCKALGRTGDIPFDLYNKSYAMAQEDIAWRALETKDGKQGIDFSWIDYQQGEDDQFEQTKIPNINPTIVLNMLRGTDPARHGENKRSMILSRWGGVGSHRYPVGFSGDQQHEWKGLAYLPYFTSTAANVAYNYWSHDTVGGDIASKELVLDYELSVRWVQVSAWSPVLRFHDKGEGTGDCATNDLCARVVPWDLPNAFFLAVRHATLVRDQLVPYMYTAAVVGMSTGLALCRPMYYEDPSNDALYGLDQQYLFGPDFIVSPITSPSGPDAWGFEKALGAIQWTIYAPQTQRGWVDRLNGDFHSGQNVTSAYGIYDVPSLVRQGAVIPSRPWLQGDNNVARARQPLHAVEFVVHPAAAFYHGGSISGSGVVIDDDGVTNDYLQGKYTVTTCEYSFSGRSFQVHLSQTGDFEGRPSSATVRLSFHQMPPLSVASAQPMGSDSLSVTYDHATLGPVVTLKNVDLAANVSLKLVIDATYPLEVLPNFIGALGRIRRSRYVKDAMDDLNVNYGDDRAQLTAYVLAATWMSPNFAFSLPMLWQNATSEVLALMKKGTFNKDPRRSKFISKMLDLQPFEKYSEAKINEFLI
eukprot:gnl/MRDRNA2_/MRDRNA2_109170_c0_seq1.p1 gnl/MRDRNA2_/MRDRNA2_109170_c0~~gnl/MRDRNA2_/MRDRNA2_109170_c0_seq1.p1  ORF type:complete len:912 (+),score=150.65 gnl/MRDRNA2_/MRDRNA2_109170_c0_seq1:94-2829(+)